jgi:hypothetical protein
VTASHPCEFQVRRNGGRALFGGNTKPTVLFYFISVILALRGCTWCTPQI